jgi:hypothetical protein
MVSILQEKNLKKKYTHIHICVHIDKNDVELFLDARKIKVSRLIPGKNHTL